MNATFPSPIVLKFGGTSVGSPEAMAQAVDVIWREYTQGNPVVVVTSALSGVTNLLLNTARSSALGKSGNADAAAERILALHEAIAKQLLADTRRAAILALVREKVLLFKRLVTAIEILGEITPRACDAVASLGERMSAPLLAAILEEKVGKVGSAEFVDAAEIIITDSAFQNAQPDLQASTPLIRQRILPLLQQGVIPVVTGFIGATRDGITTTLGRGGSDYTAALLGAALNAKEVHIYTDVNGVMSADPRIVPNARTLPRLSYREVAELAYFGAKVLHPKTIRPVIERNIPLRVRNTFAPEAPDTLIVTQAEDAPGIAKAVTLVRNLSLITVEGRGMLGVPGVAARTFASVAATETSVVLITQASSEQSITFAVPAEAASKVKKALEQTFAAEIARRDIDSVNVMSPVAVVTVVGAGMRHTVGVAGRVFTALSDAQVNIIAIAQGSSEVAISFAVAEEDAEKAVRAVHQLTQSAG